MDLVGIPVFLECSFSFGLILPIIMMWNRVSTCPALILCDVVLFVENKMLMIGFKNVF